MEAKRDENRISTLIGASDTDGITPLPVYANPISHRLYTSNGDTGTDYGRGVAVRDENRVSVLMAVSSVDGVTPVEVYVDSSNRLLTKST